MAASTESSMRNLLEERRKQRGALEAKLRGLESQLGSSSAAGDIDRAIAEAAYELGDANNRAAALQSELTAARKRLTDAEGELQAEATARRGDKTPIKNLEA